MHTRTSYHHHLPELVRLHSTLTPETALDGTRGERGTHSGSLEKGDIQGQTTHLGGVHRLGLSEMGCWPQACPHSGSWSAEGKTYTESKVRVLSTTWSVRETPFLVLGPWDPGVR